MTSLFQILMMILSIVKFVVIAHIIMSWLISFGVLNIQQQLVAQIWSGLSRLVEPVYGRIRRFLPDLGGLDLAPLIVILGVFALETILRNNAMMFI
jgi:YggT family protein